MGCRRPRISAPTSIIWLLVNTSSSRIPPSNRGSQSPASRPSPVRLTQGRPTTARPIWRHGDRTSTARGSTPATADTPKGRVRSGVRVRSSQSDGGYRSLAAPACPITSSAVTNSLRRKNSRISFHSSGSWRPSATRRSEKTTTGPTLWRTIFEGRSSRHTMCSLVSELRYLIRRVERHPDCARSTCEHAYCRGLGSTGSIRPG